MSHLDILPTEVHYHIAWYLSSTDKAVLGKTASRLRQIYSPSSFTCVLVELDSPTGSSYKNSHPAYRSVPVKAILHPNSYAWFSPLNVQIVVLSGAPDVAVLNALNGLTQLPKLKKLILDIPVRDSINLNEAQIDTLFEKTSTAFNTLISQPPLLIDLRVGDYSLIKNLSPKAHINHISLRLLRQPVEFISVPPFENLSSIHLDLARHSPRENYRRAFISLAAIQTLKKVIVTYYVCDYYKLQPLLLLPATLEKCLLRFNLHPNALPQALYPSDMEEFEIPQVTELAYETGSFSTSALGFIQKLVFPRLKALDGTVAPSAWKEIFNPTTGINTKWFDQPLNITSLRLGIYDHYLVPEISFLLIALGQFIHLKTLEIDIDPLIETDTEDTSRPIFETVFKYLQSIEPENFPFKNKKTFDTFDTFDIFLKPYSETNQQKLKLLLDYSTIMPSEYDRLKAAMGPKETRVISPDILLNLLNLPEMSAIIPHFDLPLLFYHFPGACRLIPSETSHTIENLKPMASKGSHEIFWSEWFYFKSHLVQLSEQRTMIIRNYLDYLICNDTAFSSKVLANTPPCAVKNLSTDCYNNNKQFNGAVVRFQQLALNELLMKTIYEKLRNLTSLTTTGFPGLAHGSWFAACARSHSFLEKVVLLPSPEDEFYTKTLNGPVAQQFANVTATGVNTTQPMSFKEPDMFTNISNAVVVDLKMYRNSLKPVSTFPYKLCGQVTEGTLPKILRDGELHYIAPSIVKDYPSSYHFC
ncbi:uncharacterized protein SAPINGB_P004083 [Magnusiomyces paraingens]|uniref:F-box domain-containing protein n=1 Tax=Magnusiomyces paraingens TaxID=2606893 RepID=A0A5E8BSN6_9ASCO|nr:uncharacterized protein SAPINGB_P004083 [Saprochaete ingens]VVT54453.1 unnamed protein product [Saprochaete ingens]